MTTIHIDFETRSTVDLRKTGADVYARHPSTEVLCVGLSKDGGKVIVLSQDGLQDFFSEDQMRRHGDVTFVAHNAPFELAIWNHVCVPKYGWAPITADRFVCTMAMAYAMALPGSLEGAAAATGISKQKDLAGGRVMQQLCKPRDYDDSGNPVWWDETEFEDKYQKLYDYCRTDVEVERELFHRLLELSGEERSTWLLDYKINQRGVYVDLGAAKSALAIVEVEQKRLNLKMREITKGAVATCTAAKQLADWINWRGVQVDGVAKAEVTDLLNERENLPDDVVLALKTRQEAAKSSTAKLNALVLGACEDGRMRGLHQYHGASTGRWAGRRFQTQNLPRPSMPQDEIDEVFGIICTGAETQPSGQSSGVGI